MYLLTAAQDRTKPAATTNHLFSLIDAAENEKNQLATRKNLGCGWIRVLSSKVMYLNLRKLKFRQSFSNLVFSKCPT